MRTEARHVMRALEIVAGRRGMTLYGFACAAGFDQWTRPSRRTTTARNGKTKWPGTRILAAVLDHHHVEWSELGNAIDGVKIGEVVRRETDDRRTAA